MSLTSLLNKMRLPKMNLKKNLMKTLMNIHMKQMKLSQAGHVCRRISFKKMALSGNIGKSLSYFLPSTTLL